MADENGSKLVNLEDLKAANELIRPIKFGGTGAPESKEALGNLTTHIDESDDINNESMMLFRYDGTHPTTDGGVFTVRFRTFFEHILHKIRETFGFTEDNKLPADRIEGSVGGTGTKIFNGDSIYNLEPGIYEVDKKSYSAKGMPRIEEKFDAPPEHVILEVYTKGYYKIIAWGYYPTNDEGDKSNFPIMLYNQGGFGEGSSNSWWCAHSHYPNVQSYR